MVTLLGVTLIILMERCRRPESLRMARPESRLAPRLRLAQGWVALSAQACSLKRCFENKTACAPILRGKPLMAVATAFKLALKGFEVCMSFNIYHGGTEATEVG